MSPVVGGNGADDPYIKPRPEPVATADLVARARREALFSHGDPVRDTLLALAKALEDTATERDRAHATLRELQVVADRAVRDLSHDAVIGAPFVARLARERLENP